MYEDEKEIPITDKEIELLNDMIYWLKWGDKDQKKKARQKTLGKIYYSNKELWKAWTGTLNQVDFNPFREEEAS
tara:strand:- start:1809 stop:2030 length:222 start_codon:yes stop_codon:yes gene_type:complete